MIELQYTHKIAPLGDRITSLMVAHQISEKHNDVVNLRANNQDQAIISKMIPYGKVVFNKREKADKVIRMTNRQALWELIKMSDDFPITTSNWNADEYEPKPKLPKGKFITVQWDAQQHWRFVKEEKIKKVEQHWKDKGYALVNLGGPAGRKLKLQTIWYVMSKADYHVGADSGMMHMARLSMPYDKIHMYCDLKIREDGRTPDNLNVNLQARELIRRGVHLNSIDNMPKEELEYYKDASIFIGYNKEDYVKPSN